MWVSFVSLVLALLLIPLGIVGFEYMPPVNRGEIFVNVEFPTGTPLTQTQQAVLRAERVVNGVADLQSETTMAGAYQGQISGYINNGAIGQIHLFLRDRRGHSTEYWSDYLRSKLGASYPAPTSSRFRRRIRPAVSLSRSLRRFEPHRGSVAGRGARLLGACGDAGNRRCNDFADEQGAPSRGRVRS